VVANAKVRQSLSTAVSAEEVVDSEESPSAEVMASADAVTTAQNAQSLFTEEGIQSETIEREGKPAFVICDVADEIGANLM